MTIDVLLEQYNPIKFKYKEARETEQISKEKQDTQAIQRKVEEIKNAEKQLKIVEKELGFLEKKEQRMKDPGYVDSLRQKIVENKALIEKYEKDNIELKKQQKKTERLIAKKEQYALAHPDLQLTDLQGAGPEVQELDNEISMLNHKLA